MPIIACPSCETTLRIKPSQEGKRIKCPRCRHVFTAEVEEAQEPVTVKEKPKKTATALGCLAVGLLALCCAGLLFRGSGSPSTSPSGGAAEYKDEVVDRLTEEQRKRIYWEHGEAMHRADEDADAHFRVNSRVNASSEERRRYREVELEHVKYMDARATVHSKELCEKHQIKDWEMFRIIKEGTAKKWPYPTRSRAKP